MDRVTLVTGGTGYVGCHLVPRLLQTGRKVRCLAHAKPRRPGRVEWLRQQGAEIAPGDVTDPASVRQAAQGADDVIHLVAVIREVGAATFSRINYEGTANVVAAAKEAGVSRIIHMSALGAQPDRRFPYLYTKWQGEQEVKASGLRWTIFQPSIQFGEGDEFFTKLAGLVRSGPIVPIAGSGLARFQPIWVDDTITCILKALDEELTIGQTYTIGGPEHFIYEQLVDEVMRILGVTRFKIRIPIMLMMPMAALMEALLPDPPVTPRQLDLLAVDNTTDLDSVERSFGFRPKPLGGDGLDYLKENSASWPA
ncbi:MAG: complex I NDUFA9 subunit family protein [Chloroflexi bacterium]|nr:complex I NDUFA9 subunit family protein [Chloroflexota bacterium]